MDDLWNAAWRVPVAVIHWWIGELTAMLPRSLRRSSRQSKFCLLLILSADDTMLVERTARHGEQMLSRIAGGSDGSSDGLGALPPRFDDRRYRKWPIVVRLSSELGLRKVVELPLTGQNDLDRLLYFELDRLTPFKAEDVYYAWRVLKTSPQTGRMQVELEMVPKAVANRALDLIRDRGREAHRIELEGSNDREPLNLMQRSSLPDDGRRWFRHLFPLLALGLAVTAVIIPLRQQQQLIEQLDAEVADAHSQADESLTLRERLDALTGEIGFLAAAKNEQTTMAEVLAELTRLLPDHSHINELQIRDARIELAGLADKASDLIAILDQSPMLASPEFRSPVIRDRRSGKERFQISVQLVRPSS
ncbi:MAG: PilN domain-containing protein [Geminicoccaceae bacterium]